MSRTLRRDAVFSHFVSHWVRSCRSLVTATELHIERGYLTLVQTFLSDQIHENTPLPGYYTQNYNKLHKIIQIAVKVKRCWLYLDLSYKREKNMFVRVSLTYLFFIWIQIHIWNAKRKYCQSFALLWYHTCLLVLVTIITTNKSFDKWELTVESDSNP